MRWAAAFYLGIIKESDEVKETYGFNSQKKVPYVEELKDFCSEVTHLIDGVRWRKNVSNPVQQNLRDTIRDLAGNSDDPVMYAKADKSDKYYKLPPETYNKMLRDHITQDYKKGSIEDVNEVLRKDKILAQKLEIQDRVFVSTPRECFGTLKDGKNNFRENPKMRVLNPTKPELGRVSKQLIEKIVSDVRKKTGYLQWKNTFSCLQWFDRIRNKRDHWFIQFDVVSFYSSISKQLLDETVAWVSTIADVDDLTKEVLYHVRQTFLFYQNEPWAKKDTPGFDVPMGAFDSAEVCELVGLYILHKLKNLPVVAAVYRDDGLILSNLNRQQTERIKKKICEIFRGLGLKITISANKKVIDFLDVTLNLENETYKEYRKPNDNPKYVHRLSNHPPAIIQNIPLNVNRRLNILSCNEDVFNECKQKYQDALRASGYDHELTYEKIDIHQLNSNKKNKKRLTLVQSS